ncbi:sugar transport protein [Roseiarcus fermentans]|uniref:Sugar transport protein n=1 Tax=Roseiarcus fermentans TaxID=1473586 RepID=A0A366EYI1_9HYPH|nr:MFS transporter [Roseiarcus fermentans]RBP07414.1 sugar transport protein [Roseiarcus fermentans]
MTATHLEPAGQRQSRAAAASGWIGSALAYYDFFIYATAASLVFPQLFFPSANPTLGIVASLATYGVGCVARPIGAVALGHIGDTRGRRNAMLVCLVLMGLSTMAIGMLPSYGRAGVWAPALLVALRLVQGFAVAGEISGASSMILEHAPFGRRGYFASFALQGAQAGQILAAVAFLPLSWVLPQRTFMAWGWRIPFLLSVFVLVAGYFIRREVSETPAFVEEAAKGEAPRAPVIEAIAHHWDDMLRVVGMSLMNVVPVVATMFGAAIAVQPGHGVAMDASVYLWMPAVGNLVAVVVIPFVGNFSDRVGRRPPMIVGSLLSGLLAFAYLYAISVRSAPLAFLFSVLMWGVLYQGYNAVFPSFYPELFPTRARVSGMAIAQTIGIMLTALLPALFAAVAPPGSAGAPTMIGALAFGVTVVSALAAWSARETYRVRLDDLGERNAACVDRATYYAMRRLSAAGATGCAPARRENLDPGFREGPLDIGESDAAGTFRATALMHASRCGSDRRAVSPSPRRGAASRRRAPAPDG